jgi:Zn-dependent membrane protease YugP
MAILLIILFIILVFLPQWWVKYVMKRYGATINELPGTGAELAQHLIERYKLPVKVEITQQGDHYDPQTKTVKLNSENFNGKSLTAIAIAAHEIGHAVQDFRQEKLLYSRGQMVKASQRIEKFGAGILIMAPIVSVLSHSPPLGLFIAIIGLLSIGSTVLVHLISLPLEFDASFNKALPLLEEGHYVTSVDLIFIRRVLLAAALTYVAVALASLFNVWRWVAILRR